MVAKSVLEHIRQGTSITYTGSIVTSSDTKTCYPKAVPSGLLASAPEQKQGTLVQFGAHDPLVTPHDPPIVCLS